MDWITDLLKGSIRLEVSGADPEKFINLCSQQGIGVWDVISVDDYTMNIYLRYKHTDSIAAMAERCGCTIRVCEKSGVPKLLRSMKKRYFVLPGIILAVAVLLWSSLYIWEVEVHGNETVSTSKILNALDNAGVGIGSFWPEFMNDMIRTRVLLELPELSFAGVQVSGSRAVVVVRERVEKPELVDESVMTEIVAKKTGVIEKMSTLQGVPLVHRGDAVLEGDILVSGVMTGRVAQPRPVHAMAEILARTWYEITAQTELTEQKKSYTGEEKNKFALIIGKTRINFYGNSGISEQCCDKIIFEYKAAVPGVFTLPITLVRENFKEYETAGADKAAEAEVKRLEHTLLSRLEQELGKDGKSVSCSFSKYEKGGVLYVTLRAECLENIAISRRAEFDAQAETNIQGDDSQ